MRPARRDALLALGLLALGQAETWADVWGAVAEGREAVTALFAALVAVPLAWRGRAPLAVLVAVLAVFPVSGLLLGRPATGAAFVLAWLIAVYSAAARDSLRRALAALAVTIVLTALTSVTEPPRTVEDFLALTLFSVAVPWLAGALLGRHRRAARLANLAVRFDREREETALEAAAAERARIARELHDVIAHGVSLMVVQAEAGEALMAREPDRARESFRSIQQAGREALVELRRLLGVLREAEPPPELGPQPGIADIQRLVEQVREAGLRVELQIDDHAPPVPRGVELSAYRVVQEALTNVLKHAGGTHARVAVRHTGGALELEVVDDGRGVSNGAGIGHGLAGLHERVALYGGELEAGAAPDGGYALRARLPLTAG